MHTAAAANAGRVTQHRLQIDHLFDRARVDIASPLQPLEPGEGPSSVASRRHGYLGPTLPGKKRKPAESDANKLEFGDRGLEKRMSSRVTDELIRRLRPADFDVVNIDKPTGNQAVPLTIANVALILKTEEMRRQNGISESFAQELSECVVWSSRTTDRC